MSSASPNANSASSPSMSPGRTVSEATDVSPTSVEEMAEQRSQWLSRLLSENPQLLALRERILPWTGGYSFTNVVHTDTTAVLSHVNRHVILELVYQHLHAIGMHRTAETVQKESGHEFQKSDQPWDKTDLLMLVSLGVLPREDPWAITADPHHQFVEENLEEDFFASPYREDPSKLYEELFNDALNVQYIDDSAEKNFNSMKTASLRRLVVFLVTTSNELLPDDDLHRFFLILHSITSSYHFLEHLMMIFECNQLVPDDAELNARLQEKRESLRVNVINIIKKWTNFHGLFIGVKTIKAIGQFIRRVLDSPGASGIERYAKPILASLPQLTYGTKSGKLPDPSVQPIIPDPQIIFRPALKLIDPDPREVARQITLIFHTAFKAVHSREFIVALGTQQASHQTPTLAEFFDFGERLTFLALETIITATDKQAATSQLLKIAEELNTLCNFDALACIMRALRREELSSLPNWQDQDLQTLKRLTARCGDDLRNQEIYQTAVHDNFESWEPTVPNLRTELKANVADRSPGFIDGMINWEKRWKISKKIVTLYRFQNKQYNFWAIPQIQKVIAGGPSMTQTQVMERLEEFRRSSAK